MAGIPAVSLQAVGERSQEELLLLLLLRQGRVLCYSAAERRKASPHSLLYFGDAPKHMIQLSDDLLLRLPVLSCRVEERSIFSTRLSNYL